jgi:hypothetical protein
MMPDEFQIDAALTPASQPSQGRYESNDAALTEDRALAQLKEPDLSSDAVEQLYRNDSVMKSRKVRMAMASHLRTPRRIALRIVRELYTFELMQFALKPTAAADLKRIADELLLSRLSSITLGERISLARRSSTPVARQGTAGLATGAGECTIDRSRDRQSVAASRRHAGFRGSGESSRQMVGAA